MKLPEQLSQTWNSVPRKIRQAIVLTTGLLIVIISAPIGALPGPGGTVVFLIGVTILATEFDWAERFRDFILDLLKRFFLYLRTHSIAAIVFWGAVAGWFIGVIWLTYHWR